MNTKTLNKHWQTEPRNIVTIIIGHDQVRFTPVVQD